MKKEDFSQLATLSFEDLSKRLQEARKEFVKLQMGVRTQQEKNTAKYASKRRHVAQVLTAIRNKEISDVEL